MEVSGATPAVDLPTPGPRAVTRQSRARRAVDTAASIGVVTAVGLLLAVGGLLATGHKVLIERSDSMSPALLAGDLVVTRAVRPLEARPGEIVTFEDPSRSGRSVTHRVVIREQRGPRVLFVTRGDRNGASERWSVDRDGKIGRLVTRLQTAGYVVAFLTLPAVRWAAVTVAAVILGAMLIRRIWSP